MPNPVFETVDSPYTAYRFEVVLDLASLVLSLSSPICNAAFAECDGLEMTMESKTIRAGGDPRQPHRIGPVSYGQLTLRRGMTANLDLWTWFMIATQPGHKSTAHGLITLWDSDATPRITFDLQECLPIKMRGPSLNAKDGLVSIEEMQLVYEGMSIRTAGQQGAAGQNSAVSLGGAAGGMAASVSAGLSTGVRLSVSGGPGLSGGVSINGSLGGLG